MASDPATRLAILEGGGPTTAELVGMVRSGDEVIGESVLPGGPRFELTASNVRQERTGIHARVTISSDGAVLAYDTFNIERSEERRKLAVAAATTLGAEKAKAQAFRMRIDQFCAGVWEAWMQGDAPEVVQGRDIPAAEYLLHPYLTRSRTILFAPGGSAKSWLALMWGLTLHHGLDHPWKATAATDVLYVDFEDERSAMQSRLFQLGKLMGCPATLPAYFAEGKGLKDVWDGLRRYVDQHRPGLLIVDSISRLGLGKLIDDDSANRAVDMLNRLGVPWLALAHTPKASGDHVFGSAMYEYGARVVIKGESTRNPEDDSLIGLRLSITKANHLRLGQSQTWAFRFDDSGLVEHRLERPGDFPDLGPATTSTSSQVKAYLLEAGSASASEIAEDLGLDRSRVAHVLSEGRTFTRIGKEGRRVLWGVSALYGEA